MNETDHADTVELLQALIRNRCVNDGTPESGQEIKSVRTLQEFFAGSGVTGELIEPADGRGSLVCRIPGTEPTAPSLSLVGHLDVVPVEEQGWSRDPFAGEIVDGVLWGRGAIDMLSLTAAMAVVTRSLVRDGVALRGDLVFAGVADEEAGGRFGVGWLTQNRPELLATTYAFTENGGIPLGGDRPGGVTITIGEKGGAGRELQVHGRPGHGSIPWGSKNAAVIAAEAIRRLQHTPGTALISDHWRRFVTASELSPELADRLLDPSSINDALEEIGALAGYAHALTHLTVAPTVVRAGSKGNVIPGEATVGLDIRVLPGQSADDVTEHLTTALGDLMTDIDIIGDRFGSGNISISDTPLYRAVQSAIRQHYPDAELVPIIAPGGTDARHLRQAGVIAYGFGLFSRYFTMPRFRSFFHGNDERIDLESLRLTTTALADTIITFNSSSEADRT